jgi:uncharacterized protein
MRVFFSLALLCLTASIQLTAQPTPTQDSATNQQYIINDSVLIKTRDGAHISALVVRKGGITTAQPTILVFTIYPRKTDINKAKEAADKGYAGVVAYTRGKRYSPDAIIPYEHDGADAYDAIDWIARQSWSNGKVGMYGGSYSAFTQWAATKRLHPALKTIVPSASAAPGLDVPMTNNVFMSFPFPWIYYTTNNKWLDTADYNNNGLWNDTYQQWFTQGRSYRALDTLAGRPGNALFQRWLDHPTYDQYWQNMIPYQQDFTRINIPVLTTTGYYDGGQPGATYYLREHLKYNPTAQHYFLIGPYGHFGSQGYPDSVYINYPIDPAARIPIHDIIYQWFDHILKGGPKPAILKDYINYQVMGANRWKHAQSLNSMGNHTLRLYLTPGTNNAHHTLSLQRPLQQQAVSQRIDFANRETRNSYYYANHIIYDTLFTSGLVYKTEPLKESLEISGRFTGQIIASINKKDMDYSIALFEQLPDGQYFYLSYYMGRASFARSNTKRQLLTPGRKETIPFDNSYITSRQLSKGSRIVAIVNINKSPFEQINYGTGRDVNTETIKDAGAPLHIQWYNNSYLDIPVWK